MILTLKRIARKAKYTIGRLYIDGTYFCDTLEDTDRGLTQSMPLWQIEQKKVYGQTAIPTGSYDVIMTYSPKFASRSWAKPYNGRLPLVNNVPGFSGVRVHPGNDHTQTLGCLLVGRNTVVGKVTQSADTFEKLMKNHIVPALNKKDKIRIIVQ